MIEKVSKGLATVGNTVKDAIQLWHVVIGAVVMAGSVVTFGAIYFQTAQAADVTHKQIQEEQQAIRSDMATVHGEFNTRMQGLQEQLKKQNDLIILKIQQDKLDQVNADIRANDAEVFRIQQWIEVNGTNANDAKRLRELKNEHDELEVKRNCIINNNRACD